MMDRFSRSRRTLSAVHGLLSLAAVVLLCLTSGFLPQAAAQTAAKVHRKVVQMVEPEYPTILKNGHFEGQVRLDATVLPNGSVSKVEVKGGNPMLSQYASLAVMKWKYAPGPAQTVEEVVFVFNPNNR
ncbi:MAG TPA: energy transducer TonB [Candidatus Sulfotelmatobacter sp.]|jgi:TonB family protein|nr:energy transducer TonB [Candidatus Sulfotelmatobacter sp.]